MNIPSSLGISSVSLAVLVTSSAQTANGVFGLVLWMWTDVSSDLKFVLQVVFNLRWLLQVEERDSVFSANSGYSPPFFIAENTEITGMCRWDTWIVFLDFFPFYVPRRVKIENFLQDFELGSDFHWLM